MWLPFLTLAENLGLLILDNNVLQEGHADITVMFLCVWTLQTMTWSKGLYHGPAGYFCLLLKCLVLDILKVCSLLDNLEERPDAGSKPVLNLISCMFVCSGQ
jgi:hypothetical protein